MTYRLDTACKTDGCDGTPFFGETASPGYCDSCHVRRMDDATRTAGLRTCATCGETIERVVEPHDSYWVSTEDGDSLSYVPTLHDHQPENGR